MISVKNIDERKSIIIQTGFGKFESQYIYDVFSNLFGKSKCRTDGDDKREETVFILNKNSSDIECPKARRRFYISLIHDPISEYIDIYDYLRRENGSRYSDVAKKYDINDFFSVCLDEDEGFLESHFRNRQCRILCGASDFNLAARVIEERYLLVGPSSAARDIAQVLLSAMGRHDADLPKVSQAGRLDASLALNHKSLDIILAAEREDILLHSYVQKTFAATAGLLPVVERGQASWRREPVVIPPQELRFMGETDETFLVKADQLAANILNLCTSVSGNAPSHILDIGCGYGRLAYGLRRTGYNGSYRGFDILKNHIDWLNKNFEKESKNPSYLFQYLNIYNERYNKDGRKFSDADLGYDAGQFDCFASISVFTHLYEEEVVEYIEFLKGFLANDGLWVVTFLCLPPGFSLENQPENVAYPLVKQVSEHAYIHKLEEPLLAIAYPEAFLLEVFNRAGFEVVAQRKGDWFSPENATEFQDWFVLRKRPTQLRRFNEANVVPLKPSDLEQLCNICGGADFAPGPNGRTSPNGKAPYCRGCESLERQRAVRRLFQALPIGFLDWRSCLQFSGDPGVDPNWFSRYELSVYGGENSLDMQAVARSDGAYDLIIFNHVLEFIQDDRRAFKELQRIMSGSGMIVATFSPLSGRRVTRDFAEPSGPFGAWHLFGEDLQERFDCHRGGLTVMAVEEADPCTGTRELIHFFFKNPQDALLVRRQIETWSQTAEILF